MSREIRRPDRICIAIANRHRMGWLSVAVAGFLGIAGSPAGMAADFEVKKDSQGEYHWTLQADNNKVIAKSSESYVNKRDCLRSIRIVKDKAPGCPVWDTTTNPPEAGS